MPPELPTRLTELVGVRHPIVQTGMGYVSGARLTAATADAGGLGVIASATMSLDELRSAIREVRRRTSAPFGVNLRADATDVRERVRVGHRGIGTGRLVRTRAAAGPHQQAPGRWGGHHSVGRCTPTRGEGCCLGRGRRHRPRR